MKIICLSDCLSVCLSSRVEYLSQKLSAPQENSQQLREQMEQLEKEINVLRCVCVQFRLIPVQWTLCLCSFDWPGRRRRRS